MAQPETVATVEPQSAPAALAEGIEPGEGPTAQPSADAFELGGITIWGVGGDAVTADDFAFDGSSITVNTDKRFAVRTPDQTLIEGSDQGLQDGRHANPVATRIIVPAGQIANITLAGIGIAADDALDVQPGATCNLILADGTHNSFWTTGQDASAIHNPTGATVTIDDEVANKDSGNNLVTPENGVVPRDLTLANGLEVKKGDPLSVMDSERPGHLLALATGEPEVSGFASPFGGHLHKAGGSVTINGGNIQCYNNAAAASAGNCAAALGGGGYGGDGTGIDEWITINGGRVDTDVSKTGYGHGAGIGGGNQGKTGNIRINGGYVISTGGAHGNGFGGGCGTPASTGYKFIITGGTLIAYSPSGMADIGAPGVDITITGGSIGNGHKDKAFKFDGSAHDANGNKLRMVETDLRGDVGENTYALTDWELTVGEYPYPYGAPSEFDKGHLYLWLPDSTVAQNEIGVKFTYRNTDVLDESGQPALVTPRPLFRPADASRPAGMLDDNKVRRYVDFELPDTYLATLSKYYDGTPLDAYSLADGPIVTDEVPAKTLDDSNCVTYSYQSFDARDGQPLKGAVYVDKDGRPLTCLASDAGVTRFTMTSTQYSQSTDEKYVLFKESYWGHRAAGWAEILPIPSVIRDVKAEWTEEPEGSDRRPGSSEHPAISELLVTAVVDRGPTEDGTASGAPTKGTCQAPEGRVQLYIDGQPAGDPIAISFPTGRASTTMARTSSADGPVVTAERVDNGENGSFAKISYRFTPSETDGLPPSKDTIHKVSLRFLPPTNEQRAAGIPANYLASVAPTLDSNAEQADAAIAPADPEASAEKAPDSPGEVSVDPDPTVPDPSSPHDKEFKGTITAKVTDFEEGEPNPGRVIVKLDSLSGGPISVSAEDGTLIEAELERDQDGRPVRDEDGKFTLYVDPLAAGSTMLTVRQDPTAAYAGTTFVFDVTVVADPTVAPRPSLTKRAVNLTHPHGPTQPGDTVRYEITASNGARGSIWSDVIVSDPLPACMELVEGSVSFSTADGAAIPMAKAPASSELAPGRYAASGEGGRTVLAANVGDVAGRTSTTLTFECRVKADLDVAGGSDQELALANVASASGTRPDPDDPSRPMAAPDDPSKPLPVEAGPTEPALPADPDDPSKPAGPDRVTPADPEVRISKTVANESRPDAAATHAGDVLSYEISLVNDGSENSCLANAVVSDPLPAGIEYVAGSMRMKLPDGSAAPVPDDAYDAEARTIAVSAGDLWGGQKVVLSFETTVREDASDANLANVAHAHGGVPSEGSFPEDAQPALPAELPQGGSAASSDPASPAPVGGEQPGPNDPATPPAGGDGTGDAPGGNGQIGGGSSAADVSGKPIVPLGKKPSQSTPSTGDAGQIAGGSALAIALLAASVALAARRRTRA